MESFWGSLKNELVHHQRFVTREQAKQEMASKFKASLFITGHTHVAVLEKHNNIIYLNPGSPAMSKRADKRGTVARLIDHRIEVLDVATGQVLMSETL